MKLKLRTAIVLTDISETLAGWALKLLHSTAAQSYSNRDYKLITAAQRADDVRRKADEIEARANALAEKETDEINTILAASGNTHLIQ